MTRVRVVWRILDIIYEECPLFESWYWQDEDMDVFAALKHPNEGPFAWLWVDDGFLSVRFLDDRKDVPFPKDEKEQALRYIYAQFLFVRET